MYKLTKELGYRHVRDFLSDQSSIELSGWIEYERIDGERQINMVAQAIAKAFAKPDEKKKASIVDDDDEVIDTTKPGFAEKFKGFSNSNIAQQKPQRPIRRG